MATRYAHDDNEVPADADLYSRATINLLLPLWKLLTLEIDPPLGPSQRQVPTAYRRRWIAGQMVPTTDANLSPGSQELIPVAAHLLVPYQDAKKSLRLGSREVS